MEKLKEKLIEWKREAERSISNLKEPFVYQKVIDEIDRRLSGKEELTWEHHFDELKNIWVTHVAVDANTGEISTCPLIDCNICLFGAMKNERNTAGDDYTTCTDLTREWLFSPYKPIEKKPKLTREEFIFLKALKGGYIAKDEDGDLWLFGLEEPFELDEIWRPQEDDGVIELDGANFKFIKWEDKEPYEKNSHKDNQQTLKVILKIIQIVVNYEE